MAGLLGDTTMNVENLGKSAIEGGMRAAGKTPPTWLDPVTGEANQAQYPLTSAWIRRMLAKGAGQDLTRNPAPNDTISSVLHGAGAFGAGMMVPMEGAEAAMQKQASSQLAKIAPDALTGAQRQAAAAGLPLGMRLTPGQASGSKPLQQIETWAQSHPWTSGPFQKISSGNQTALNRTAAQSIGENADTVDSTVLGRAAERLGDTFENARSPNHTIMFDPTGTKGTLDSIDQEFQGLLPNGMDLRGHPLVRQLSDLADRGHTTAEQLGQLSSKLGKAAYKQMTTPGGDRDLGQALYKVKDHADDVLESSLGSEERGEYSNARGQYRNLMHLVSRTNTVNPSTGNVSGVALANRLQQVDRPGFLFGRNTSPLYQAARFSQAFKPLVGDSGTATRLANPFDPWELLPGAAANLGSRFYLSGLGQATARGAVRGAAASRKAVPASVRALLSNPVVASGLASQR